VTVVRTEQPGDEEAIRGVNLAAFPSADEADLVDALRRDAAWLPGLSFVAESDDQVVGHLLLTRATVSGENGEGTPVLALGPMAVLPAWHDHGIGSALVRAAIESARDGGETLIVVLGHPWFYPKFGFRPARAMGLEPPGPWPDPAWMALSLQSDVSQTRGTVHFAAPFAAE